MDFEEYLKGLDLSDRTVRGYLQDLALFAKWFDEHNTQPLAPAELTPTDLREYRAGLVARGLAPASINRRLAAIRAWGDWAVTTHQLEANPAEGIKGIRQQARTPKWLDRKQQARMIREVERDMAIARTPPAISRARRNIAIVTMLMHTGLRISELCALRSADVELGERSGKVKVMGKGSKVRYVPLNAQVRSTLAAWIDHHPRVFMFPGQQIETLTPRAVVSMLSEYGRRANVPVSPHILRHTFAKNLVDAGIPLDQVAALLGHSKLETTRIYTMPGERDLEKAVEKLEL